MKLTDEQWRARLTEEEFRVCRQAGTEPPFTGKLLHVKDDGKFVCTCCGQILFDSEDKFDSGCGWPSFSDEAVSGNIVYRQDHSHGMLRTEIVCQNCDAHLGHVFEDGPLPTGQRYCVNSVSLKFQQKSDTED